MISDKEALYLLIKQKELGISEEDLARFKRSLEPALQLQEVTEDTVKALGAIEEFTEEELRWWHTPYFDELQERKESARKAKEGL